MRSDSETVMAFPGRLLGLLMAVLAFIVLSTPARSEEPPAKAVDDAFSKARACKAVDDAFAKAKNLAATNPAPTPAPKPAAKAVEDAFAEVKAKIKPTPKETGPELLPPPREVQVKSEWYIDCPAGAGGQCDCSAGCPCPPAATTTPKALAPWDGRSPMPAGMAWQWSGEISNGRWVQASTVAAVPVVQVHTTAANCPNGKCPNAR